MHSSQYEELRALFRKKDTKGILVKAKYLISQLAENKTLSVTAIYHPLGFIYLRLHEFENKESIRIHIWDKQRWYQKPLMDIHDHYYTVNSFVYKGWIVNNVFTLSEGNPNYTQYVGEYSDNDERILKKTDQHLFVELSYSETITEGQLYQIGADKLHSSCVQNDVLTCTIVYTENPGTPSPLVLGPFNGEDVYFYPNRMVETKVINEIINKLIV